MKKKLQLTGGMEKIRDIAEEKLKSFHDEIEVFSGVEAKRLLHELQVHQIELEMQNEELRQTQQALEESREKYFDLYNQAPVGYISVNEKGIIIEANLTSASLLQTERKYLINILFSKFIYKEDQDTYYQKHKRICETGIKEHFEIRLINNKGKKFWTAVELVKSKIIAGECIYLITFIDLTLNRDDLEKSLQASEMKLRHLTESILDVFTEVDHDLKFIYWNKAAEQLSGISASKALGKTREVLFGDNESSRKTEGYVRECLKTKQTIHFEHEFELNGEKHIFDDQLFPSDEGVSILSRDITEKKYREEILKENEQKFSSIFHLSPLAITLTSIDDGKYYDVNETFIKDTGYSKEEIIGKTSAELKIFSKIDNRVNITSAAMNTGQAYGIPCDFRIKNGEIISCLISINTIHIKGAEYYLSTIQNVSEVINIKNALHESEEKYKELVTNARGLIFNQDANGRFTFVNEYAQDFFGFNEEELIGKTALETVTPQIESTGRRLDKMVENIYKDPDQYSININENIKKNGERVWIEWHNKAMIDKSGKKTGHLCIGFDITERIKAEEALKVSEQRLKYHFENSPLAVIEWDKDYFITQWSKESEIIFGWKKEEVIGKPINSLNLVFEDDIYIVEKTMNRLSSGKELTVVSSNRNYTKSGKILNCIWYNSVLIDEKGKMSSVMSLVEDITEKKKIEKQLKENEEKLWSVLNATQESIYMFNREGKCTLSNSTGLKRLNIENENELIGHNYSELLDSDLAKQRKEKIDEVFNNGKPLEFEDDRNGMLFHHYFFPIFKDKEVVNLVTYSTDITDRKKAEEALKESEKKFRIMANSIPQLAWIANADGYIFWYNQRWYDYTNRTPEDMEGWGWQSVHDPKLLPNVLKKWKSSIANEKPFEMVFPLLGKDGKFRSFLTKVLPLFNDAGELIQWFGTNTEITELQKTEQALKESEKRFKLALKNAPVTITSQNLEGIYTYAYNNKTIPSDEVIGKKEADLFAPEDLPWIISLREEVLKTGKAISEEHWITANGKKIFMDLYYEPSLDEEGKITGIDIATVDHTIRKLTEEKLVNSRQQWVDTFNQIPDLIAILDNEHRIVRANDAMLKKLGLTIDKARGKFCYECVHGEDSPPSFCPHAMLLKDGKEHVTELFEKKLGGDYLVSCTPIYDTKGKLKGSVHVARDISERKQAEKRQKKDNEKLEILSVTASVLLSSEKPFKAIQKICERVMKFLDSQVFFNYIANEDANVLNLNAYYGIPDETAGKIKNLEFGVAVCGCVAQKGERIIENDIQHSSDPRTALVRSFGIQAYVCHPLMENNKVIGTLSFGTNIRTEYTDEETELMKTIATLVSVAMGRIINEQILKENENILRLFVKYSPAAIAMFDNKMNYIEYSNRWVKDYGFDGQNLRGKNHYEILPEVSNEWKKIHQKCLKGATEKNNEDIFIRQDGNKQWLKWEIHPWKKASEEIGGIVIFSVDITEIKQTQEKLKETYDKLQIALDNADIGIWEWNLITNEVFWDTKTEKMFGLKEGTFGKTYANFEKLLNEEDIPHIEKALQKAIEENIPFESIYRISTKKGDIRYINAKGLVYKDNEENPIKMSGVCVDITEMKKGSELALFKLNEELLRSNKELAQFAYVASHDLQEPLRMVTLYTQLLAKRYNDKLEDDGKDFINFAVEGATRMHTLIEDLLKYSRVNTQGDSFNEVDMTIIIDKIKNSMFTVLSETNTKLTIDDMPLIRASENQMLQLMQNLLSNAIKFSKNKPIIHIKGVEKENEWQISVKDNGIGLEDEYKDRIFQIFQRLHTREEYPGTGIGLAICKRIVEKHNGKIWVESKKGKGSTFYFTIPKKFKNKS